ncbi:MAG: MFS transporter, partial [Myxococcota bacterium]
GDLQQAWGLEASAVGWVTSSVQLGFIVGTLVSALWTLADRLSPRWLFMASALMAGVFNLGPLVVEGLWPLLFFRFCTGVALAGIYPVGMALAASWYREGLGKALGFLVGALVLGTALPHLLRGLGGSLSWRATLVTVSVLAVLGGLAVAVWVPEGPFSKRRGGFRGQALRAIFAEPEFRAAALGYFGHMWELYAMWAFVPTVLAAYAAAHAIELNMSLWSGLIIAAGAVGCAAGGLLTGRFGSARVAAVLMGVSGVCCLALPLMMEAPWPIFLGAMLVWGVAVVGDSPQLSTLNAQTCPPELVGSGLTIATSLGFATTIVSIELLSWLRDLLPAPWLMAPLAVGPAVGLWAMRGWLRSSPKGV